MTIRVRYLSHTPVFTLTWSLAVMLFPEEYRRQYSKADISQIIGPYYCVSEALALIWMG